MSDQEPLPTEDLEDIFGRLRERADRTFEEVTGVQIPQDSPQPRPGSFLDHTHKLLFGDVWNRGHLSMRERRLITLTAMAARGHNECTTVLIQGALRSGDFTDDDWEELFIQLAFYLGWPPAMQLWLLVGREREKMGSGGADAAASRA